MQPLTEQGRLDAERRQSGRTEPSSGTTPRDGAAGCIRGKIKVLQFAYGTSLYGAERGVLALIKHLEASRVETIVGCIRKSESATLQLVDEADRLGFRTLVFDGRRRRVRSSVRGLRRAIRAHGIDVVHSHGPRQDLISLLATRSLACSTLSTPHGWEPKAPLIVKLHETLNKGLLPFFDAVAPLSRGLTDSLRCIPIPPSRLHPIPNGVDLGEVEGAVPLPGLLPGQASSDDVVIGYIGRLMPGKGVDVLLQALARLGPSGWHCLILGEGPARAGLESQACQLGLRDRIRFLGFRPDRLRFLKRFDICVLPSYSEGMPRILLEALAAGIPSVASSIPGVRELLEDGVTGTTFPPGDPERLADAIRRTMADRANAAHLAKAGKARVYERYSAVPMARAYESLYEQLCRARR